ncbi:response regulator transcription factor [Paenibacillus whitsoniae]|uniref:Response regulator n=1 Tax=Paenibacillus whitsoniae TaxID=2496558 RepID=A0A430J6F0_9BACL|nr:response regulator [Paenibacillus whitsoniae]RTE04306.1 response regulator [Paenibacillus whitsoniae]
MYNVLLAEDEPPILFMIKALIEASHSSFQVNNWAFNGKEAWAIVQRQKPDVLVTDIKMPFIDGLELMAKVKDMDPRIPCIVLTGFHDFEFVRDALRLHAFDYLLKPVKEEQLKQVLDKLFKQLAENSADNETGIIRHCIYYGKDVGEEMKARIATLPYAKYDLLLVRAGAASKLVYDTLNPGRRPIRLVQMDLIELITPSGIAVWVLDGLQLNEKIIVMASNFAGEIVHPDAFAEELLRRLQERSAIPFHVFVGDSVERPELLRDAADQLRRVVTLQTRLHRSGVYPTTRLQQDAGNAMDEDIINRCKLIVQEEKFDVFMKALELWSKEWLNRDYTQELLEMILQTMISKYEQIWYTTRIEFDANEVVASCTCLPQVVEEFGNYMKPFFERRVRSQQAASAKDLVHTIEHYLNTHYMEPISNEMYHSLFGYNKNYISNVFSEIMGIPPSKYLMKVRILKAKSLIVEQPHLPLKTVAELVGYDDPLYFSRVFKNEIGFSPKEYREMISRGEELER